MTALIAPFPWFGGKRRVAPIVWAAFGDVHNYVEPFFGSGAVLLGRPEPFNGPETVNDKDGFVSNFWRALKADPETVIKLANRPVNENDLHAIHAWLVQQTAELAARLEGDPGYYDAKVAAWWLWGICAWIGSGFCRGKGPWVVENGKLVRRAAPEYGINRQLPHLGNAGMGINRQLPHLGNAGRGIHRKLPHLGNAGMGINRISLLSGETGDEPDYADWLRALSARLKRVRVCSGDWSRVCGPSPTFVHGLTGVFMDPPYSEAAKRDSQLYRVDDLHIADAVREWCVANGDNPLLRIALCGYEGEHEMPPGWRKHAWATQGGYASQGKTQNGNRHKERISFSPHCLPLEEAGLFEEGRP